MSNVIPPPPPPRGGDSCWKWGGITCVVGCLGLLIVFGILAYIVWPKVSGFMQQAVKTGQQADLAGREMKTAWQAVEKFHADKGKYPDALESLVPKYLKKEQLRFSQRPQGKKWTYHKPAAEAAENSVMLEYNDLTIRVAEQTVPLPVRIFKNGEMDIGDQRGGKFKFEPK